MKHVCQVALASSPAVWGASRSRKREGGTPLQLPARCRRYHPPRVSFVYTRLNKTLLAERACVRAVVKRRVDRVAEWALALGIACLPFGRHVHVVLYHVDEYTKRYGGGGMETEIPFMLAGIAFIAGLVCAIYARHYDCGWKTRLKSAAATAVCAVQIWWWLTGGPSLPAV